MSAVRVQERRKTSAVRTEMILWSGLELSRSLNHCWGDVMPNDSE